MDLFKNWESTSRLAIKQSTDAMVYEWSMKPYASASFQFKALRGIFAHLIRLVMNTILFVGALFSALSLPCQSSEVRSQIGHNIENHFFATLSSAVALISSPFSWVLRTFHSFCGYDKSGLEMTASAPGSGEEISKAESEASMQVALNCF